MPEASDHGAPATGWHDDPIRHVGEDRLRRAPVAKRAAELIDQNHSSESSVVYGLEGPWGSGKSSVIALLTSYLAEETSPWQVVTFTPWATTGTEGLFSEFFAALATVAPESRGNKIRELMVSYAAIARPMASLIPVAGNAVVEASRAVEDRLAKPWNVAFEEISDALRDLGTPVLVVVDDIDRLQSRELLDLLKVVRLLGRFPGVDFLVAYDEQTLVEILQSPVQGAASKARARAFMEKIVQYPMSVPPLLTSQIVGMLDVGLTEIMSPERGESELDASRFGNVLLTTLPRQLPTPRAIDRFLAQVREQFRVHDVDEIDDVDLVLATFLRVRFPDVFARLQSRRTDLTKVATSHTGLSRDERKLPEWDDLVQDLEREDERQDAMSVLGELFPAIREPYPSRAYPGRFAHRHYFDRYIAQAIPDGDVPDRQINKALAAAAGGSRHDLAALLNAGDNDRARLVLSKIRERYPDVDEGVYQGSAECPLTLDLLAQAVRLIEETPDDRLRSLISTNDQLRRWAATLLRRLLVNDPNLDIDPTLLLSSQAYRRAQLLTTAGRNILTLPESAQQALHEALQREVERILPLLLADLRAGDESDQESGSGFLYELVTDSPTLQELKNEISKGLAAYEFTLEDIGARMVGLAYTIGGSDRPSSASFRGELFTKITGVPARSVDHVEPAGGLDTSWPGRRAFAQDYIGAHGGDDD